jgi:hypothetical protein
MSGKRERARAGLLVGGRVAYGYRYRDGKLEPDEQRAPIAQEIFRRYDAGESMRSIALWLRSSGAPSWSGKQWGHSSVQRILINETYAGVAYYGSHRREGKLLRLRAPSDRIRLSVPALIDRAQWERVQRRIAENPSVGRPSVFYLLRGLLFCSCGRRMSGNTKRRYRSYRCSGRDALRFHGGPCRCSISAAKIDSAVWDVLVEAFTDSDFLRAILERNEQELRTDGPEVLERLEERLKKLRRKEDATLSAMIDSELADARATLRRKYKEIHAERLEVEAEIAKRLNAGAESPEWLSSTVELLRGYIPTLTEPEQRQAFIRGCVTRARWDGTTVQVDCCVGGDLLQTPGVVDNNGHSGNEPLAVNDLSVTDGGGSKMSITS